MANQSIKPSNQNPFTLLSESVGKPKNIPLLVIAEAAVALSA